MQKKAAVVMSSFLQALIPASGCATFISTLHLNYAGSVLTDSHVH